MATSAVNLARLLTIRNDIKDAIENKGVTIPSGTAFDDYPTYISQISGGGSSDEPIYGVSGLYQRDPALTRTDDAVGMDFVINSSSGTVDSDFNDVFPWNETVIVTNEAGKFLRFPRMYFRVGADSSYRLTDVAVSKAPRGSGNWYEVAPFMYGCYKASIADGQMKSVIGKKPQQNKTRAQFRAFAAENGSGYSQLDLYHRTVLMFLWFIEFATKNSTSIMTGRIYGSGTSGEGYSTVCRTGGTDAIATPSGFETAYAQMRYHYIEDFVGNGAEYIDGVYYSPAGTADYVTADVAYFSDDTTGKTQLCYPSPENGLLSALGWDSSAPFLCLPNSTIESGAYIEYFCDRSNKNDSSKPVAACGTLSQLVYDYKFGLTYFMGVPVNSAYDDYNARLIKRL
jgi:hypothetical protein